MFNKDWVKSVCFGYLCTVKLHKKKEIMQALRQIVSVRDNFLHVVLPDDFKADKVEIIILPVKEQNKTRNSERFSGAISKETAEKLYKHLNEVRNEWERDIC